MVSLKYDYFSSETSNTLFSVFLLIVHTMAGQLMANPIIETWKNIKKSVVTIFTEVVLKSTFDEIFTSLL